MADTADFVPWSVVGSIFVGIEASDTAKKDLALQGISRVIA
jgi:hypothetical protein